MTGPAIGLALKCAFQQKSLPAIALPCVGCHEKTTLSKKEHQAAWQHTVWIQGDSPLQELSEDVYTRHLRPVNITVSPAGQGGGIAPNLKVSSA